MEARERSSESESAEQQRHFHGRCEVAEVQRNWSEVLYVAYEGLKEGCENCGNVNCLFGGLALPLGMSESRSASLKATGDEINGEIPCGVANTRIGNGNRGTHT